MSVEEVIMAAAIKAVKSIPWWVPYATVFGLHDGARKGLDDAKDFRKKYGLIAGMAAAPFIVVANIIAGPFILIKHVHNLIRVWPIISSCILTYTGIFRNVTNNIWECFIQSITTFISI